MDRAHWWEVKILSYSGPPAEIALALYKMGSHGIYLEENKGLCFHPDFVEGRVPELYAYFPFYAGEVLSRIKEKLPHAEFIAQLKSESELAISQNRATRKIGSFTILPPWEDPSREEKKFTILSGIAFGSGSHPTTKLALSWLSENYEKLKGKRVLDAGSGTGILSIACAISGASVVAVDVAMKAVLSTLHNVRANGVGENVKIVCADVRDIKGEFEVIISNMIAPVLLNVIPHLLPLLLPGGRLFITGIMKGEEKAIERAFKWGSRVVDIREFEGWMGYEIQKSSL